MYISWPLNSGLYDAWIVAFVLAGVPMYFLTRRPDSAGASRIQRILGTSSPLSSSDDDRNSDASRTWSVYCELKPTWLLQLAYKSSLL